MKILKILAWIGAGLFIIWGLIALVYTWGSPRAGRAFFFWYVLPYPVLIALTLLIIAACGRNSSRNGTGFTWFAVVLASAASIGLLLAVSTVLYSIISWAYFGNVRLTSTVPTDPKLVTVNIVMFAACYIWAGAISAALSPSRPMYHALAAGGVLLLWSCAITLLAQPLVVWQLITFLVLPIPLAAWGARLQQARMAPAPG